MAARKSVPDAPPREFYAVLFDGEVLGDRLTTREAAAEVAIQSIVDAWNGLDSADYHTIIKYTEVDFEVIEAKPRIEFRQ